MKKLLFIFCTALSLMMSNVRAVIANKRFNLKNRAFYAAIYSSKIYEKDRLLSLLIGDYDYNSDPKTLPNEFVDLVNENMNWTFAKQFGLEEEKIRILEISDEDPGSNGVNQLHIMYEVKFDEAMEKISSDFFIKTCFGTPLYEVYWTSALFLMAEKGMGINECIKKHKDVTEEMKQYFESTFDNEICGICKKTGADVFWFSPVSHFAHQFCFNAIKGIEKKSEELIAKMCKDNLKEFRKFVQFTIAQRVQEECKDLTLLEYIAKNGRKNLRNVFDDVCGKLYKKNCDAQGNI